MYKVFTVDLMLFQRIGVPSISSAIHCHQNTANFVLKGVIFETHFKTICLLIKTKHPQYFIVLSQRTEAVFDKKCVNVP